MFVRRMCSFLNRFKNFKQRYATVAFIWRPIFIPQSIQKDSSQILVSEAWIYDHVNVCSNASLVELTLKHTIDLFFTSEMNDKE